MESMFVYILVLPHGCLFLLQTWGIFLLEYAHEFFPIYNVNFVGWLVGFYGVSTFVGYSTPNSVYMYIPFTNEYLVGKIFYKEDFTCLHMIDQF